MTYACPAWEFAVGSQLLKLQRLQNKVLRIIGNLPRRTSTLDLHVALKIPVHIRFFLQNYAGSRQKSYKIMTM
jgi:hypothetical protein